MSQNSINSMISNLRNNAKLKLSANQSMEVLKCSINKLIESKEESICSKRIKLNISQGIWKSDKRLVEVINNRNISHNFGFIDNSVKFLDPFEALFLMESDLIEVLFEDIPLSIEESFQLFLKNETEIDLYRVYGLLSRSGYFVKRHQQLNYNSEKVESLMNRKRKLSFDNNYCDNDCSKESLIHTNYYELSDEISNYKSMTNIRKLNTNLLPKKFANYLSNESNIELLEEKSSDSQLSDNYSNEMSDNKQNISSNESILYDIEDNDSPIELDSCLRLFKGSVKPLCSLATVLSSSQLYDLIKSFGPKSDSSQISTDSNFDLMLDVYKPNHRLDESPLFHVIVTQAKQPMPQFNDILYLKSNSRAQQIYFAVIDSGDVNFYSLSLFDLNDEFPVLWQKCLQPLPH
jgi:tRNA splicing endonuclease